jgi:DnaJ-class molecular chaperone
MTFESKRVHCESCDGTGKGSTPFRSGIEELKAEQAKCFECDGTGKMEIRKSEKSDWASCCPSCGGQGFNDVWNARYEEHDTVDCVDCNATGGIPYSPKIAG